MSSYSQKSPQAALLGIDPAAALAEIRREKAERNLSEFIRQAWPVIEPGTEYIHTPDSWPETRRIIAHMGTIAGITPFLTEEQIKAKIEKLNNGFKTV